MLWFTLQRLNKIYFSDPEIWICVMHKLFHSEINFNRTSLCSSSMWCREKHSRWVLARWHNFSMVHISNVTNLRLGTGHVWGLHRLSSVSWLCLLTSSPRLEKRWCFMSTHGMSDGGIILIFQLLGCEGGKSSERLCPGSSGLQTACWAASVPTATARKLTHQLVNNCYLLP